MRARALEIHPIRAHVLARHPIRVRVIERPPMRACVRERVLISKMVDLEIDPEIPIPEKWML